MVMYPTKYICIILLKSIYILLFSCDFRLRIEIENDFLTPIDLSFGVAKNCVLRSLVLPGTYRQNQFFEHFDWFRSGLVFAVAS